MKSRSSRVELTAVFGAPGGHGVQTMRVNHDQFSVSGAVFGSQFPACTACVMRLLGLLLMLLLGTPAVLHAQFVHTTNNGTITITGYTGPGGAVVIPDTINGLPVTRIGDFAFYNKYSLTSVTIPNSVTSIGNQAFQSCTSLTSVTIGNSVTSIGNEAFLYCISLTDVTIPNSVTNIGNQAFLQCSSLTDITIPSGLVFPLVSTASARLSPGSERGVHAASPLEWLGPSDIEAA